MRNLLVILFLTVACNSVHSSQFITKAVCPYSKNFVAVVSMDIDAGYYNVHICTEGDQVAFKKDSNLKLKSIDRIYKVKGSVKKIKWTDDHTLTIVSEGYLREFKVEDFINRFRNVDATKTLRLIVKLEHTQYF